MKQSLKTVQFSCGVTVVMLTLSLMPPLTIGGEQFRKVDFLSDLKPSDKEAVQDSIQERQCLLPRNANKPEVWPDSVTAIEDYSQGKAGGMNHFYRMLNRRDSLQRPVRIAFLGDSFIEGDILAGNLREMLQNHFGGNGVGWIDVADKTNRIRPTVNISAQGWKEHNAMSKNIDYNRSFFSMRYATPVAGTACNITLKGTTYKPHAATWQQASVFLSNGGANTVSVSMESGQGRKSTFQVTSSPRMKMLAHEGATGNVDIAFTPVSPTDCILYGVALESKRGIIVDNFSLRGFAGNGIQNASRSVMREFANLRAYDLIILEYGLNTANNRNTDLNYKLYINKMKTVIGILKEAYPATSILIMGVPDRSERTSEGFRTMPCIKAMTSYQRELAASEHVSFYSLFHAMGGKGSMKTYVDRKEANKDYTHLTFTGGERLARRIYQSFLTGLDHYNQHNCNLNQ